MQFELTIKDLNVIDDADPEAANIVADIISMVSTSGFIEHPRVIRHIREHYGRQYLRVTEAGNPGISPDVGKLLHKAATIDIWWSGRRQGWGTSYT